jgi:sugar lactone lactonase YvrE
VHARPSTAFSSLIIVMLTTVEAPSFRGEGWKVEALGVPVNAVNYENSGGILSVGPGGKGTMFYTSYYRSTGAELVGFDFRTGRAVRKRLASKGGYGVVVGESGVIYIGGVGPGDLYRYEPPTDDLTTIYTEQFGVEYIWDCAIGGDGTVYCAAGYPKTKLVAYSPKANQARNLGEMVPGEQYLRSLCVDKQGKVWCGIGMKAHLVVFDPATGCRQEVLPMEYADSSSAYDTAAIGDYVLTSINFVGVMLVYDSVTMKIVRTIPRPTNQKAWMISSGSHDDTAYLWTLPNMDAYRCNLRDGSLTLLVENLGQVKHVEADRWLHTVNDQSYLVYDLKDKKVVAQKMITEGGDGMEVFSLSKGPDGNVYGSTALNMHLFRCDTTSDKLTDLGKVTRWAGQVDSMSLGSDGRIYIGAYTDAVLSVYDPRQPWQPGRKNDSNPREIGPVGEGQYRTRANCLGPDGRIYVGSIPAYRSGETGALTVCDPETGKMDVHKDFVRGGVVDALVADDNYVYGAGGGELFVFDPKTSKKVFREERKVTALAVVKRGRLVISGNGKIAVFDRQQGRIVEEKTNSAGDFTHMVIGPDELAYGVNPKHVARITADGTVETLTNEGGKFAAVDARGRVYFAQGPKLLRCSAP